jgi:hypothetical protein
VTIPAEGHHVNDLEVAAEEAGLTGQIRSFIVWLGEGRKLTQTGRIGLADARHLVEVLGTGDEIDPEIGGRVFKTTSSEQLPYLTRIVEWMKAARLVRATGTRLVPACIAGEGACPPEDSGGPHGFEQLKELLAGPPSVERDQMLEWAGGDYDPARFDLAAANAAVAAV